MTGPDTPRTAGSFTHNDRMPESQRPDAHVDTARILDQLSPTDRQGAYARHDADMRTDVTAAGFPSVQFTDTTANAGENTNGNRNANRTVNVTLLNPQDIDATRFDDNHDNNVSRVELERHLNDPRDPRAAVAGHDESAMTLRRHFSEIAALSPDGSNDVITPNDMRRLSQLPADHPLIHQMTSDLVRGGSIGRGEGLYDENLGVTPRAVQQGVIGNGTFMATFASLASTEDGRRLIAERIRPAGDGFVVTFADGRAVRTPSPTSHDQGVYTLDTGYGNWPSVMVSAAGRALNGDPLRPQAATESRTTQQAWSLMFGANGHYDTIPLAARTDNFVHSQLSEIAPRATAMVADTTTSPGLAELVDSRGHSMPNPVQLEARHPYAVIGYDPQTRQVLLRDPRHSEQRLRMSVIGFRRSFVNFDAYERQPQ